VIWPLELILAAISIAPPYSFTKVRILDSSVGALRVTGWEASPAGLRRLRTELLAFLRAALTP
jgi:hypothetical protein